MTAQQLIAFPGTSAFRSIGGTAGTQEVQIFHDGTNGSVLSKLGNLSLQPASGGHLVLNLHNWPTTDGSAGYSIVTNGSGQLSFANVGTGSLTSIVAGTGLTGGTITNSGTIAIGTSGVTAGTYAFPTVVVNALGQVTSATAGTPVTSIATGTGLTGGAITSTGTISMGTSGVTAGTYGNGSNLPQITVDALGRVTAASNISFSAGGNTRSISQTAHGFSVGNVLGLSGTSFVKALADTSSDAEVVGIVSTVTDANDFVITTGGYINTLSGLTAGSVYFLSATTSGLLTTTAPSTAGQISKPLLIADSGTSGYFYNMRGQTITVSPLGITGPGTSTNNAILTWNGTTGGTTNNTVVTLDGTGNVAGLNSIVMNGNIITPGNGFINKFRNPSFDVAQRGFSGTYAAGTAYCVDGWILGNTGGNVSWSSTITGNAGVANVPQGVFGCLILTGTTGVTDCFIKQRIESTVMRSIAGAQVVFQMTIANMTGAAITPTLTVKHPTSTNDNWGTTTTDLNAVALQTIPSGSTQTVAYSFTSNFSSYNGAEFTLDFGTSLNGSGKYVVLSCPDVRQVLQPVVTGTVSNAPTPENRNIAAEMIFCQRYFQSSYDNGVAPGSATGIGAYYSRAAAAACDNFMFFKTPMRTDPTVIAYSATTGSANKFTANGTDITANYAVNSENGVDIYNNTLTVGAQVTIHWTASAEL